MFGDTSDPRICWIDRVTREGSGFRVHLGKQRRITRDGWSKEIPITLPSAPGHVGLGGSFAIGLGEQLFASNSASDSCSMTVVEKYGRPAVEVHIMSGWVPDSTPGLTYSRPLPAEGAKPVTVQFLECPDADRPECANQARLRGDPQSLATADDYPSGALRKKEEGITRFRLTIQSGRASACEILASSGSKELDDTACRMMQRRSRFELDADDGVGDRADGQISWVITPDMRRPRLPDWIGRVH